MIDEGYLIFDRYIRRRTRRRLQLKNEDFDWEDFWDFTFVPMAKVILSGIGIAVLTGCAVSAIIVVLKLAILVMSL